MTPTSKQNFDLEQEKMLPGVVMAVEGQVFDMLYQLADLDEPRSGKGIEHICKEIYDIVLNQCLISVDIFAPAHIYLLLHINFLRE